jgi:hypothetical protein
MRCDISDRRIKSNRFILYILYLYSGFSNCHDIHENKKKEADDIQEGSSRAAGRVSRASPSGY